MNNVYKIPAVLGLFFVILLGLFYVYLQNKSLGVIEIQDAPAGGKVQDILALAKDGDFSAASSEIKNLEAEAASGTVSLSDDKQATLNHRYLITYKASGEQSDAIEYIRRLKENVLNLELPAERRADDLSRLAFTYCSFGRDEETIREIFKGEPFSQYWVEGDTALGARKLLEWAYNDISPNARAAAQIGRWYVNRALIRPLDKATIDQYLDLTKRYVGEAETLNAQEIAKRGSKYTSSRQYAGYLYWHAFIVNGLIAMGDKTYTVAQARAEYDNLRKIILAQDNASSLQLLPYAYIVEAKFITVIDKDEAKAKMHLKEAIRLVRADPYPKTNEFAEFARDSWNQKWGGYVVTAVADMAALDPEFRAFIEDEVLPNKIRS